MSVKGVKEIHPVEAWESLQKQLEAVLVDVRTAMEYHYVGHPVEAVHVPWQEFPEWREDLEFPARVRAALEGRDGAVPLEQRPVLMLCRSGTRSRNAGLALLRAGFQDVSNISEGFEGQLDERRHRNTLNGWRFHNLPWEQS